MEIATSCIPRGPSRSYNTFHNLASEFTYHYFHHCHKFDQIQGKKHEYYYSMEGMSLSHCRKDSAGWKILLRTFLLKTQSTIVFFQIPMHPTSPRYCLNLGWFLLISIFDKLIIHPPVFSQSVSSVTQSYLTLCNLMDCSMPGFPIHHQLPELTQTHVHRVSDAIQPSHPLWSPSPSAPNPSQHQGLFQ